LAKDLCLLYGRVEFSYRDLTKLAQWTMRCAPSLDIKAGISFFSVHADWLDWSDDWRTTKTYPVENFVDLLNQTRWLSCGDPRDHIYSLLGHPLARLKDGSILLDPGYNRDPMVVWFDLAVRLLAKHGLHILSPIEHNDDTSRQTIPPRSPGAGPKNTQ